MRVHRTNETRRLRRAKVCVPMLMLMSAVLVAACSSGTQTGAAASGKDAPRRISAKSGTGTSGVGPVVVVDGENQVVLPDRTLVVNGATRQAIASANFVSIRVEIALQNTGDAAFSTEGAFFSLMGAEGDTFGATPDSAKSFEGDISGHTRRTGTISFDVPPAATSSLRLLYRPNAGGQTVMIPLRLS
jgi:Domain of unknown function (DUF4352)